MLYAFQASSRLYLNLSTVRFQSLGILACDKIVIPYMYLLTVVVLSLLMVLFFGPAQRIVKGSRVQVVRYQVEQGVVVARE